MAGLHTRDNHHVVRADIIRRYTDARFDPIGLDEYPDCLDEEMPTREVAVPRDEVSPADDVAQTYIRRACR